MKLTVKFTLKENINIMIKVVSVSSVSFTQDVHIVW